MPRGGPADTDTETLLVAEEDHHRKRAAAAVVHFLRSHATTRLTVALVDAACILLLTGLMVTMTTISCDNATADELIEWCEPFRPVDKVIVHLDFELLVHCDEPRACVAYTQHLMEKHGFNYNFVLGDEQLVYVGKGFQCHSDALLLRMLVTRYTWDPRQPVYRIPPEVILRYGEIMGEGVRCAKILPNFTLTVTCGVYGAWCGSDDVRVRVPWYNFPRRTVGDRHPWCEPSHPKGHPFLAFDVQRVYEPFEVLNACNCTRPTASYIE